ncbi:MAG TPA: glycosyltransferase [Acidimicrobiia bacterium]|jgi:UDP:flavonoid glycosyltransferase YjiC (YdhE family)
MRILAACSLGGSGHLQPMLPFLDAARREGRETLVVAPPALSDMVAVAGYDFSPGGEPAESLIAPIRERLPIAPPREAAVVANRDLFAALATDAMLPSMRALVESWRPNLIIRDPSEYASAIVAQEAATPVAQIAIGLAEVEWNSIEIAASALEQRYRGLPAILRASPYATRFPASLDPSRFPSTQRYDDAVSQTPSLLPDWWNGSRHPLIYVTFGTVLGHMTIANEVYRAALDAVSELEARVLLTVGRRFDPMSLGVVPGNVHVEQWVDQNDVFREAAVVVCHGGSGTTFGALRAGLPVVVVPLFADQHANGVKVVQSGSGVVVDLHQRQFGRPPFERSDSPRVADAVRTVLSDSTYRQHARVVSDEIVLAPTAGEVLRGLVDTAGAP